MQYKFPLTDTPTLLATNASRGVMVVNTGANDAFIAYDDADCDADAFLLKPGVGVSFDLSRSGPARLWAACATTGEVRVLPLSPPVVR